MTTTAIVNKGRNFCHTLREDSVGYGDYLLRQAELNVDLRTLQTQKHSIQQPLIERLPSP